MHPVFQLLPQENLQYSQKHIQQIQQIINSIEEMSSHFEQKTATDTLTGTFMLYRKDFIAFLEKIILTEGSTSHQLF